MHDHVNCYGLAWGLREQGELMYLTTAARRAGIGVRLAEGLAGGSDGFPEIVWLRNRRFVSKRKFVAWLARTLGQVPHAPPQHGAQAR